MVDTYDVQQIGGKCRAASLFVGIEVVCKLPRKGGTGVNVSKGNQ